MHDAEKTLLQTRDQVGIPVYCETLSKMLKNRFYMVHATPLQRAECFLRTIGKWTATEI